ncbi:MAG: hypothetical protein COZ46_01085 [Verrucomicrobia bacterium CG_4_10_14_3_um_filter_43_23]|nr:MAG: hypothetical protein COX01_01690 [Verrucomicrobia bacterium CG22_combo_CG10-13_8_21_14_all_43_17]PIX58976.1 MAG: hypothetical protein COZ46_01085 [Verrucomicrobia bacterium CG_4_10_14_3_um_filter_43_23]PIY62750.1 MAG: hypothetical protein COY94_01105 [Verrucomicrobia bacterium CG_4_10_14_0_8_um_filter_43_34]PJA44034.1 MAG: hypothetical protein CO175_04895 [Verrucomicrobia bacterium CG_4_9_14_3_um_filter_43_20]
MAVFMGRLVRYISIFAVAFVAATKVFAADGDFLSLQNRIKTIFQEKKKAVVRVVGTGVVIDPEEGKEVSFQNIGTGFFISNDGYVMTSATVVFQAHRIWVEYDGVAYTAEPVGIDLTTAVAILKVIKKPKNFEFLHLNEKSDLPDPGTFLLAITCKLAFDPGPSFGMATGVQSYFAGQLLSTSHIRSDLPSDGGDAGAPVFDLNGRFVGMLAWTLQEIRASFTLPAAAVLRVRDDLLFSGEVVYGYLGLDVETRSSIKHGVEVYVVDIIEGSPGSEASIERGDVILAYDSKQVKEISDLHNAIFFSRPGQVVTLKLLRNGNEMTIPVKVAKIPTDYSKEGERVDTVELMRDSGAAKKE